MPLVGQSFKHPYPPNLPDSFHPSAPGSFSSSISIWKPVDAPHTFTCSDCITSVAGALFSHLPDSPEGILSRLVLRWYLLLKPMSTACTSYWRVFSQEPMLQTDNSNGWYRELGAFNTDSCRLLAGEDGWHGCVVHSHVLESITNRILP